MSIEQAKQKIASRIEKYIVDNNLSAKIVSIDVQSGENESGAVKVSIDRKDYARLLSGEVPFLWSHQIDDDFYFDIKWVQNAELIHANVGDFVLIYSKYDVGSEDVGLVSTKFQENGEVYYGCRYIKIDFNEKPTSSVFTLTAEDYGGYHKGFLEVIPKAEVMEHMRQKLTSKYENAQSCLQERYKQASTKLESLVIHLSSQRKIQCDKVELSSDYFNGLEDNYSQKQYD